MSLVDELKAVVKYENLTRAAGAAYNCRAQPPTHHHKADEIARTVKPPLSCQQVERCFSSGSTSSMPAHCIQPRAQESRYYNPSTYNMVT